MGKVQMWDIRSFERNADARFWLNGLAREFGQVKVEAMTQDENGVTLVVAYWGEG